MKKHSTLLVFAALAFRALSAQAQFTVDGTLGTAEVGTGTGKYQLLGSYSGTHSVNDRGLKAIYLGTTATTLNVMVVATPEQTAYSALVLYLDAPNRTGIAAGTRLPGSSNTTSQLRHRPTLDMQADFGFRITVSPLNNSNNAMYLSRVNYTTAGPTFPEVGMGTGPKNGAAVTDAADPAMARTAFATSSSVAANNATGWEFEIPLSALGGAATGDLFRVMAAYVADNGDFYSDVLPQVAGQTTDLGTDPNFTLIPRSQFFTYQVGTGLLATRSEVANALGATAYPNPLTSASQLSYTVSGSAQPVSVDVYTTLGQRVLTLLSAEQKAGTYQTALAPLKALAAGHYLVKLQVGSQLTSRHVVVE